MITVEDFINMATASFYVEVYDCSLGELVYNGNSADIPDEIMVMRVQSFDPPSVCGDFCLNVFR